MIKLNKIINKFKINLKKKKKFFCIYINNFKYKFFKLLEIYGYITKCFFLIFDLKYILIIYFKYIGKQNISIIKGLKIYNRYKKKIFIKKKNYKFFFNLGGLGIISTSKGIMSIYKANYLHIGGILIYYIW